MIERIPWEPPPLDEAAWLIYERKRVVSERNKRDHEYEEKAAERVLERFWDWEGK